MPAMICLIVLVFQLMGHGCQNHTPHPKIQSFDLNMSDTSLKQNTCDPGKATPRVPVVVISGYLGSGKTTFIASLLNQTDMQGTAVIVNELAEVGIDQSILTDAGADDVLLLSNGCLCCGGGSDLRNAVARLLATSQNTGQPIKRILLETSGAADPGPIMKQICFDPMLRSQVRYAGVMTLFDAQHGQNMLARDPVGFRQIALADHILLTKTDITEKAQANDASQFVAGLNPNAEISPLRAEAEQFIAQAGRGVAATDATKWVGKPVSETHSHSHDEHQILTTWSIRGGKPLDWRLVEQKFHAIFEQHGEDVLRTKGILWTAGDNRPLVIHGINRHFHRPVRLTTWEGEPYSRLVVIGFAGAAAAATKLGEIIGGQAEQYVASAHTHELKLTGTGD